MAVCLWKLVARDIGIKKPLLRYGHLIRGKPPGIARTLQQRLDELNYKDPSLTFKVDIGLPQPRVCRSEDLHNKITHMKRLKSDKDMEKQSRKRQLEIPLEDVKEEWMKTKAGLHIKTIADHYGIYDHLYGDAYFVPQVMMTVRYKQDEDTYAVVHRGNVVKPSEATVAPEVSYSAGADTLWTLLLTNLDGDFSSADSEHVHWFIGNIPGADIGKGEEVYSYLQPFPPRGTGYHRFAFVLYKQHKVMDYSQLKKEGPCLRLKDRTFKTLDFYRERQDDITPAGLAFFQSDWDSSLTNFFHNTLNMMEPVYEYDFPKPYIRPQTWFPLKQPFNLYMDKYRDEKQIAKEFLLRKLKKRHPFKKPDPPPLFPNAVPFPKDKYIPSWLKLEIRKERLGWGRVNDH